MTIRYLIVDSHKNMSQKRREALISFFGEVKGAYGEDARIQVDFCDWYESDYAVKWFEVLALSGGEIAGYLRCFRNPDDVRQWYIGDVHVRSSYRRHGVATKMYQKVFKELEHYEAAENVISAVRKDNARSIGLHTKMGFVDTKEPCVFADFYVDEDETKYQKLLYRLLPIPEKVEADKLMEMFLPLWFKHKKISADAEEKEKAKAQKELRKIIKSGKSGEYDIYTIWCGNRLAGFKYLSTVIGEADIPVDI